MDASDVIYVQIATEQGASLLPYYSALINISRISDSSTYFEEARDTRKLLVKI